MAFGAKFKRTFHILCIVWWFILTVTLDTHLNTKTQSNKPLLLLISFDGFRCFKKFQNLLLLFVVEWSLFFRFQMGLFKSVQVKKLQLSQEHWIARRFHSQLILDDHVSKSLDYGDRPV